MHEQAISSVRTTALRSVIAMQQESRFVDREEDDGSDRRFFQWVAPCCGEDECSASFKDKRKKFVSYVSEEACAKHMINHLYIAGFIASTRPGRQWPNAPASSSF